MISCGRCRTWTPLIRCPRRPGSSLALPGRLGGRCCTFSLRPRSTPAMPTSSGSPWTAPRPWGELVTLVDGVPGCGITRLAGEGVAQAGGRQGDERDGGRSPDPAATQIAAHDQGAVVLGAETVPVEQRKPSGPGHRCRLAQMAG